MAGEEGEETSIPPVYAGNTALNSTQCINRQRNPVGLPVVTCQYTVRSKHTTQRTHYYITNLELFMLPTEGEQ